MCELALTQWTGGSLRLVPAVRRFVRSLGPVLATALVGAALATVPPPVACLCGAYPPLAHTRVVEHVVSATIASDMRPRCVHRWPNGPCLVDPLSTLAPPQPSPSCDPYPFASPDGVLWLCPAHCERDAPPTWLNPEHVRPTTDEALPLSFAVDGDASPSRVWAFLLDHRLTLGQACGLMPRDAAIADAPAVRFAIADGSFDDIQTDGLPPVDAACLAQWLAGLRRVDLGSAKVTVPLMRVTPM
jgi:hypothetical protein